VTDLLSQDVADDVRAPGPEAVESRARPGGNGAAPPIAGTVVLDTSVLISDPDSLFAFPGAAAVIPLVVIEELDGHKSRPDDVGRAAREVIRTIEDLRRSNDGDIRHPVALPGGGTLRIETNGLMLDTVAAAGLDPTTPDNRILAAALGQQAQSPTTVVSNDAALRIKAAQVGLCAIEHHRHRNATGSNQPTGWRTAEVSSAAIDSLYRADGPVRVEDLDAIDSLASPAGVDGVNGVAGANDHASADLANLSANEFVVCRAPSQSVLVRHRDGLLTPIGRNVEAWGLRPRSKEQAFALDLLCDPEVTVVALDGMAGTGKTILALAAGLEQVMESGRYDKVSVYRPVVPVGKAELGYLPGSLDEKLDPWMVPVTDALVALTDTRSHADARAIADELTSRDKLSLEAVTYLRGRTLQGTFVVVDESQNLEPTTLKTILTRVGEGTKVVFTGDTSQIDAPYLSEHNNAVSALVDAFTGESCFGHVRLTHCERSEVASLAALRL
jgi:PhoH-like ATPase